MAGRAVRGPAPAAAGDHLRDQPTVPGRRPGGSPRRRGEGRPDEPDRGGAGPPGPDGEPGDRRDPQHERRGGHPLGAPPDHDRGRFRGDVPRAVQQQDQRRHPPALAAARQPGPGEAAHRGGRRGLGHGPREAEADRPAGRRRRRSARSSWRPSGRPRCGSWTGSRPGRASRSTPTSHLRHADQAHPRVQAATAERAPDRGLLQPPPREPVAGCPAPDVPVRRQGGPGVPAREAHHQADQRRRLRGQQRPGRSAASFGSSSCRITPSRSPNG